MELPPLSLYVHLPWCVRKCPYCDFNSYTAGAAPPKARYLDALVKDLEFEAARVAGRELGSVFLGGGTPSFFSPGEIGRILDSIARRYRLAGDVEITMEANPGTVESGAPAGYRAAGVNRLSLGVQSFDAAMLAVLGRIHTPGDVYRAVEAAQDAGFARLNLDLMHGLPGQDLEGAMADLEAAVALGPEHVSWYQLTLEPNTVFHARPPEGLPDEELAAVIQDGGHALLAGAGYEHYEVSAWARPGGRSRHNLNYWTFGDYAAAGAGAHGKLTSAEGVHRYAKPANPQTYILALESLEAPASLGPALAPPDRLFEFMLNGLRLPGGFEENLFVARTGLDAGVLAARAAGPVAAGLLERSAGGRWRPTGLGMRFLNDLQAEFLP